MKFDISIKNDTGSFIKVGWAKPSKSCKAWQITFFTNRLDELPRSPDGKFCNAIMVENKFPDKKDGDK